VPSVHPDDPTHAALLESGAELVPSPLRDPDGSIARVVAEADVVMSGGVHLGDDVFSELRHTRLLLRPYVGYDDIDVDSATKYGILVANVPDAFIEEVANQAMAFILATNRQLLPMDRFVRSGEWGKASRRPIKIAIRRPSVLTLGLIGFGNIARLVAERAKGFGFTIVAHDPFIEPHIAQAMGVQLLSLEDVLRYSDVISVHVFLSNATRHLLNAETLALMKPTAWLINTSRGPVIDELALIDALRAGRLAGAGLDVFDKEPLPTDSPLMTMNNVLLSPHMASYSEEGMVAHRKRTAEIALQVALGGLPQRHVVINKSLFDTIAALPELEGVERY
jgi:D-3-phosphoglycerate dehydrogenase